MISGRKSFYAALEIAVPTFESKEYNQATQFMRAKKAKWPVMSVRMYEYESKALWSGRAVISQEPLYILERADAWLSNKLDPTSAIVWRPKDPPPDPGPTWAGIAYNDIAI